MRGKLLTLLVVSLIILGTACNGGPPRDAAVQPAPTSTTMAPVTTTTTAVSTTVTPATEVTVVPTVVQTTVPAPILAPPSACDAEQGNRISIPELDICAPLVGAPVIPDGNGGVQIDVPGDFQAGLAVDQDYQTYVNPGQPGFSLIAGHVNDRSGPNVFNGLEKLQLGSLFTVWQDGLRVTYRIEANSSFPKPELPWENADAAYSSRTPLIWVITCDENSPFKDHHYLNNVVVQARPVWQG